MSGLARRRYRSRLVHWRRRLEAAYRATTYGADGLVLHVDARHPALDARLAAHGCQTWAYLTAANPRSRCLSAADNAARMAALRQRLVRLGMLALAGESIAEAPAVHGLWPAEPGLLVLGCGLAEARRLARFFGQNALLYGVAGGWARLHWLAF